MIFKKNHPISALLLVISLSGCGTLSVPTGSSEEKLFEANSQSEVVTNLKGTVFSSQDRLIWLDIDQYRLMQRYSVPKNLVYSKGSTSFSLDYSNAKPLDSFEWEPMTVNYVSVHHWLKEVSLISPKGTQINVPVKLVVGKVELDLDEVIKNITPGLSYTISCERCKPEMSNLQNFVTAPPPASSITTNISFILQSTEYVAIQDRVQEKKRDAARLQRELALIDQRRNQQIAQDIRESEANATRFESERKMEAIRIARDGDSSSDDLVCKKYGFKPNTQSYANCRLQIDMAKQEMQRQQAYYEDQQRQYQAAAEAAQKRRQSDFLLGMGLRMMGGQNASGAAIDQSVGAPMAVPIMPNPTRMYTFPNGRTMTCTTTGSVTNCF